VPPKGGSGIMPPPNQIVRDGEALFETIPKSFEGGGPKSYDDYGREITPMSEHDEDDEDCNCTLCFLANSADEDDSWIHD